MRGGARQAALAAGLAAILAAAGCGDESGDGAATPREQIRSYFAAFNAGDGERACALLSTRGRYWLNSLAGRARPQSCERTVEEIARDDVPIRALRIERLRVDGARATATLRSSKPDYRSDILLVKTGDGWRIDYPPAVQTKFDTPPGVPDERDAHRSGG